MHCADVINENKLTSRHHQRRWTILRKRGQGGGTLVVPDFVTGEDKTRLKPTAKSQERKGCERVARLQGRRRVFRCSRFVVLGFRVDDAFSELGCEDRVAAPPRGRRGDIPSPESCCNVSPDYPPRAAANRVVLISMPGDDDRFVYLFKTPTTFSSSIMRGDSRDNVARVAGINTEFCSVSRRCLRDTRDQFWAFLLIKIKKKNNEDAQKLWRPRQRHDFIRSCKSCESLFYNPAYIRLRVLHSLVSRFQYFRRRAYNQLYTKRIEFACYERDEPPI